MCESALEKLSSDPSPLHNNQSFLTSRRHLSLIVHTLMRAVITTYSRKHLDGCAIATPFSVPGTESGCGTASRLPEPTSPSGQTALKHRPHAPTRGRAQPGRQQVRISQRHARPHTPKPRTQPHRRPQMVATLHPQHIASVHLTRAHAPHEGHGLGRREIIACASA